jgi:hypothetical protein
VILYGEKRRAESVKKSFYIAAFFVIPFLEGCATIGTEQDVMATTQICGGVESGSTTPIIRLYGGNRGDGFTSGRSLASEPSGEYVIAGVTQGLGSYAGNTDLLLARIHGSGWIQWARIFGGPQMDIGTAFTRTADSGHIQAGESYGHLHTGMAYVVAGSDMQRLLLLKTNSLGNYEWHKLYLTRVEEKGRGSNMYSILQAPDGGFLISGSVAMNPTGAEGPQGLWSDVLIAKTDADGNALWGYSYGGSGPDEAFASVEAADGGFTIAGTHSPSGDRTAFDALLLKVDQEGRQEWVKTFGGAGVSLAKSVVRTPDSGYAIVAETNGFGAGGKDILLIKTDEAGVLEWARTFGEAGDESPSEAVSTSDGGLLLTGYTSSFGVNTRDALILKTDKSGRLLWVITFGEAGDDAAFSAIERDDGSFTIVGMTESYAASNRDIFVLHLVDPNDLGVCLRSVNLSEKLTPLEAKDTTLIKGDIELLYQQDSLRKLRSVAIQ